MRTYQLKINVNNIRKEIQNDYFKYKDIFYKCLVINLSIYNALYGQILTNSIIDDSHYNQFLIYINNQYTSALQAIELIDTDYGKSIFLDTNIYIEEFIKAHYNPKKINLFSCTIDDSFNIVITNKHINHHVI